ncbi:GYF domain-containing protein [Myxococcus sp. K38C18041901]|uniref:GYF domain-containing protein n=1 Tax=Myxococcus guangdongensis TaxID=2906760 RepID=UPI0020A7582C|nr:GYF domain-containing protein [Myxococcus guangdongensis]MCP3060897.1 GYF domain-containing protein [Myxococcus guangdongensis]
MVGDSRDGKSQPDETTAGPNEPDGGGAPVFGGVSEAELDVFVSKLRTDKNPRVAAAASARARNDVNEERLHKGVRRSLVSSVLVEEDATPTPVIAANHSWFLALGAQPSGPFDAEALKEPWARGELRPDTLCWRAGFQAWVPVSQVPELVETLMPATQELSAALDAALTELPGAPSLAAVSEADVSGIPAWAVVASASEPSAPVPSASMPVDPVGAHAVLAEVTAATEQVEAKWRLGGWWFTLAGGVAGGVTVAIVMGLFGSGGGVSHLLSRLPALMKSEPPVAPAPAPVVPAAPAVAPVPTELSVAPVLVEPPPGVAAKPPAPVVDDALARSAVGTPGPGAVIPAGGAVAAAAASSGSARPSLTGVVTVERGGSVPVVPASGGSLASEVSGISRTSRQERDVESAPPVAQGFRVADVKLSSRPTAPAPTPAAAPEAADDDLSDLENDLGPDAAYARELSGPASGTRKREPPPSVYIPPVAPIQNPRLSLTQSDVFEVVLAKKGEVTACANVKPRPVDEGTRVVVRWSVLPSGEVSEVVTETASLRGTSFARCIEAKVRAWDFPKHQEQGGPVRFPFVF